MQNRIRQWIQAAIRYVQDGQGLVEYSLILVLIAMASIAILSVLGGTVNSLYSHVQSVWPV
jgi:Flp pilus assembly pilin Flp